MDRSRAIKIQAGWWRAGVALLALWLAGSVAAAPLDPGAAIDVAGRQRMLSQRIVKAYCQVGMNVTPAESRTQLGQAVQRFDRQLAQLRETVGSRAEKALLGRLATQWQPFRRIATAPASKKGARALMARDEALLRAAHDLVLALQQASSTAQARLVNMSGRQRMLSQRMAKLYMLRAWGPDTPTLRDEMDNASNEFTGALAALRAAAENTPEIAIELEAVSRQWEWFTAAIAMQGAESYVLVVADASEAILTSMERITGMYAALTPR